MGRPTNAINLSSVEKRFAQEAWDDIKAQCQTELHWGCYDPARYTPQACQAYISAWLRLEGGWPNDEAEQIAGIFMRHRRLPDPTPPR